MNYMLKVKEYMVKVCYFTKKSLQGLTASHMDFNDAMKIGDDEAAYDYKNTIY